MTDQTPGPEWSDPERPEGPLSLADADAIRQAAEAEADTEQADAATECTIRVGVALLRSALKAVLPHADKPKLGDDDLALARVRLIAGRDELLVVATNESTDGATSAQAAVPIDADSRQTRFAPWDGPFVVDLHPTMVRDLLRVLSPLKPDRDTGDTAPSATGWCDVLLTLERVRVTDVSGLWPGRRAVVPVLAHRVEYPDVPGIIARALQHASGVHKPFVARAGVQGRFEAAGDAYDAELEWMPSGSAESSAFVVTCGDYFAGVAASNHAGGNSLKARDRRRMRHLERAGLTDQPVLA